MNNKSIILHVTIALTIIFIALTLIANKLPSHTASFTFFSLYLIIFTGYILSKLLFRRLNALFRVLVSFILGFFAIYSLLLVSAIFRFDCTYIRFAVPLLNIISATLLHRKYKSRTKNKHIDAIPQLNMKLKRIHLIIIVALLTFVVLIILISRDPFIYTSDSNDHVSYIRTISRTHEAFPEDFYYKGGGILTRDLRKSLYHSLWGAIEAITRRKEVHEIWPIISAYGSVFFIIALICSMILIFGQIEVGIIAAFLFVLLYHGGLKAYQLITIAYGYPFGKIFYLLFISSAIRHLLDSRREFAILAILSLIVASWTHIAHLIIGLFTFACFALLILIYRDTKDKRASAIRGFVTVAVFSIAISAPYLIMRYIRDYHPNNLIHTHIQGVLHLNEKLFVINPLVFFEISGYLGVVSLLCLFLFTRAQKREPSLRLLIHTLIAVYTLIFNPLWFPILAKKLSYLLIRFEFSIPAMILPAFLMFSLVSGSKREEFVRHRVRYVVSWIVVLVLIVAPALSTVNKFAYSPGRISAKRARGFLALMDLYDVIKKETEKESVIASDPLTSYAIPAFTDRYVICPYDQHSTPNDSTALERIARCRLLYDIYAPLSKVESTMRIYGASYLVINGRIPTDVQTMFWKPTPEEATSVIKKFKKKESGFTLLYEENALALFKLSSETSGRRVDGISTPPPLIGDTLLAGEVGNCKGSGIDGVLIRSVTFSASKVKRGDTLTAIVEWVATKEQSISGYVAYLRFDTDFKKGPLFRKALAKPYRKLIEKLKGTRYRFRVDFQPLDGIHPPYSWPLHRKIIDKHVLRIPKDVAQGRYRVSLKLDIKTQYPNYYLSDILSDEDMYSGEVVGEITVE